MKNWKLFVAALPLVFGATAHAQSEAELRTAAEARAEAEAQVEIELAEAEAMLAEAAARVAELSTRNLPEIVRIEERIVAMQGRPRLGVTIASDEPNKGPVEGVEVIGVTPGSAAAEAGIRSGDVLTAANDESLSADSQSDANTRLLNFMMAVDEGDKVEIDYLRDGNVGSVTVEPRAVEAFSFVLPDMSELEESIRVMPRIVGDGGMAFAYRIGTSWADMELVELSEGLGRYFGTDKGLLVVSAPKSGAFDLEDGDVIQSIDGREPASVNQAIKILGTYEPGQTIEISIMRDKRRQTLEVEMPDNRMSRLVPEPRVAPAAPVAPAPLVAPPAPKPARHHKRESVHDIST